MRSITRRQFMTDSSLALGAVTLWPRPWHWREGDGRLSARPAKHPGAPLPPGDHILDTFNSRDTVLVVPSTIATDKPAPLMLALHGATQSSEYMLRKLRDAAEAAGTLMLAPSSVDRTWDAIVGLGFTIDCERIDQALKQVFQHFTVDPHRLAIAGFSDGASYSLSLGVVNGDLFSHIIAYSPGFMIPGPRHGHPPIFISHRRND